MTSSLLHGAEGGFKYLNAAEHRRFLAALEPYGLDVGTFCTFLAHSGARISEALSVLPSGIDPDRRIVSLMTLKRRKPVVREVPIPDELLAALVALAAGREGKLWK